MTRTRTYSTRHRLAVLGMTLALAIVVCAMALAPAAFAALPTELTVASANQPAGAFVGLGTTHAVDGFTFVRSAGVDAIGVTSVTIADTGTAPASTVAGVQIYRDNAPVGFGPEDTALNATPATFTDTTSTVVFDASESVSASQQGYWVVYKFDSGLPNGGDVASSLLSVITQTGAVTVTNNAVVGNTFTVDTHSPLVAITAPSDFAVFTGASTMIFGTASDFSNVMSVEISIQRDGLKFWDGSAWVDLETWIPTTLAATGTPSSIWGYEWTFDPVAQDGTSVYTINARGANPLGLDNLGYALPVNGLTVDNRHVITVAPSTNGTITPPGDQTVAYGGDITFSIAPDPGYHIGDVAKNGSSIGASSSVTFTNVIANGSISATFLKDVTVTAIADSKTYDGTPDASVTVASADLDPLDGVTISYATATFADKNIGGGKLVTVSGINLVGANAGKYYLTSTTATTTADITAKGLTIVGSVAENKTYDGSVDATVSFVSATLSGVVGSEDVGYDASSYTASFADKNVADAKPVTVSGVLLTGIDKGNYTLAQPSPTANITKLGITGAFTADNKPYDGNAVATVATRSLVGTIAGDVVSVSGGTAAFSSPAAADGKTVVLTGATLVGVDKDNYTLISVADTTANITKWLVTATAANKSKTVGTLDPPLTYTVTSGSVVSGDSFSGSLTRVAGEAVGTYAVTQGSLTLGSNYTLTVVPATFTIIAAPPITYTLTYTAGANGTISGTTPQTVVSGASGTQVTAVPATGYHFVTWSDGITTAARIDTNVTANKGVTASFAINATTYTLTYTAGPNGTITGASPQTVNSGAGGTIMTAVPNSGYHFVSWSDGVTTAARTDTNVTANINATATFAVDAPATKQVDRLGGQTRYDVTRATAEASYPGWVGVKHVVLASGEDRAQPDALTAAGLAGVLDAPLMLVPYSSVNDAIKNAVKGMPAGVKVHIVGGPNSVSTNVEKQVRGYSNVASVDRIAGSNRYGTAAAVARRMKAELAVQGKTLPAITMITNGNFPTAMFDALTASAISAHNFFPVLLVKDGSVPGETSDALRDLGLTKRYIIGGTTSVKSSVQSALGVLAANRISGATRYSTATAAATRAKAEGWLSNAIVGFAAKVPDAATGGAFMGKMDGALVYVTSSGVPGDTASYLTGAKASIGQGVVFGGTTSVPASVRVQLQNLIK